MLPGMANIKGRLLVATPVLDDPNFARTVIYIVEHHDEGALGLVLNRPSSEQLGEPLDRWVEIQSAPPQVFSGGPVEPDALIALANTSPAAETGEGTSLAPLTPGLASADLAADPALVTGIDALRVFRGYSGWSAGQLELEIETGSWLVLDSVTSDIFTDEPDDLWRVVLRRQPGRLGWLADAPDDLSWN